jgi:hypothetical protein
MNFRLSAGLQLSNFNFFEFLPVCGSHELCEFLSSAGLRLSPFYKISLSAGLRLSNLEKIYFFSASKTFEIYIFFIKFFSCRSAALDFFKFYFFFLKKWGAGFHIFELFYPKKTLGGILNTI